MRSLQAFLLLATALAAGSVLLLALPAPADAGAIISNGEVTLGVADSGTLGVCCGSVSASGTAMVGLRDAVTNLEGVTPGCTCEGWGASGGGASGARGGSVWPPVPSVSFTSTATTATAVDQVGDLTVTHAFFPSATPELYQLDVTLQNSGAVDMPDVRYRRVVDFDAEPTPFNELTTLDGPVVPGPLLSSNDNGFCNPDPLEPCHRVLVSGPPAGAYYTDSGPADHGASMTFGFGALPAGASLTFTLFYGVSATESDALSAVGAVGAQMWSLAQSSGGGATGAPATFVLAVGNLDHVAPPQCVLPAIPGGMPAIPPVHPLVQPYVSMVEVPTSRPCLPEEEKPLCLKADARLVVLGLRVEADLRHLGVSVAPADGGRSSVRLDPRHCL